MPVQDQSDHRRIVLVTTLIALTTFFGAIGAWRATEAGGAAAASERKALSDERTAAQRQAVIRSGLASIEFDFMRQSTHRVLAAGAAGHHGSCRDLHRGQSARRGRDRGAMSRGGS